MNLKTVIQNEVNHKDKKKKTHCINVKSKKKKKKTGVDKPVCRAGTEAQMWRWDTERRAQQRMGRVGWIGR